jgi:penicillin amidase
MSLPTPARPEDARPEDELSDDDAHARLYRNLSHRRSPQEPDQLPASRRIWIKRVLIATEILVLLLIIAVITSAISLRHAMHAAIPQLDGNISIAGLSAPVTITRDAQGVPSIHAANLDDLLFAQGFITAQDRLFQMDALRRHGAGELAEILGPSLIEHDREQRYLQLRAAADRAVAILPADRLQQLQAYARGVNAFITTHSSTRTHTDTLPVEFHILHYTPAPWSPRDSVLIALIMSQDLSTEFPTKLNREALSAHLPADLLADLYPVGSWRDRPPTQDPTDLTAPSGPVEQIPLDPTQSLNHAPTLDTPHNPTLAVRAGRPTPGDLLAVYSALRSHICDSCRSGSNSWAVAGNHSISGGPLLSNDMHLGLTAPDIWYEAALHVDPPAGAATTPAVGTGLDTTNNPTPAVRAGLDVTGFTIPGVPFVIVGRNPFVAWAFTNSGADVQDLLIEHLRGSGSSTEFEHPDGSWSLAGHQIEHIQVRGGRNVTLDILTTTHTIGATTIQTPIISPLYKSEHRALALAWTIYDPSTVTNPFFAIDSATDAASLVAAASGFNSVSQNLVYADAHHIGYHLLGCIPIRGPAIQRPRVIQPFILPNNTPSEDEEDESGPQASSHNPSSPSSLLSFTTYNPSSPSSTRGFTARQGGLLLVSATESSSRPNAHSRIMSRSAETPVLDRATRHHRRQQEQLPTAPTTAYTIGSPISPVPVDALDSTQAWSGYIPYDQLPSVLDPSSGLITTANARITTDNYPYFIANDWVDAYRVERINHLLQNRSGLTPADMLAVQTDVHSEFDLLVAQRLAYALDHSALTHNDPRLHQAADLLRNWTGDVSANSPAAAIVAAARAELWPMLLAPQIRAHDHSRMSGQKLDDLLALYTWEEKPSALEQILQHTPARWLPHNFANWNDFLATDVQRGLRLAGAPSDLSTWSYGSIHPIDIAHPIFGSHSPISTLLGVSTGSGFQPNGGDSTTISASDLRFGPSERFTSNLADPDDTHANITTGESGNPASRWFLDQFLPWLHGTTFTLPLFHPTITHTLTLTPN